MAQSRKNISSQSDKPNTQADRPQKKTRWVQIRLFPIWLRVLLVIGLLVVMAVLGVMVGYGVIGEGNAGDALKWETWQHILDIMRGET
ncbi:DNA-directed RNA polymerase subunit beta [Planococcus sp. ISL-109]|uniref:DNA-directed RNA polymerase subunit beta n=1 Tax=Planococcus sp. ISL-109 TaxID=2819166 RepID=UPI001BE8B68D|nr:DNA-directed RNA polymerase subunit beta [Planococcus sp. ISL-109]MBT2583783.1 DNA-directed RNA polymerase subunit beta [Planococcus sp. ISL-109]